MTDAGAAREAIGDGMGTGQNSNPTWYNTVYKDLEQIGPVNIHDPAVPVSYSHSIDAPWVDIENVLKKDEVAGDNLQTNMKFPMQGNFHIGDYRTLLGSLIGRTYKMASPRVPAYIDSGFYRRVDSLHWSTQPPLLLVKIPQVYGTLNPKPTEHSRQ